jgi:hypothetical protein
MEARINSRVHDRHHRANSGAARCNLSEDLALAIETMGAIGGDERGYL